MKKDNNSSESSPAAKDGLKLVRLFAQLKTQADRDEAIRLLEAFVNSVKNKG